MRLFHAHIEKELKARLAKGIVRFTYYTKNGFVREAIGTRNLNLARRMGYEIPTPKSGVHKENAYFDCEKRWWRSYRRGSVVSIEG